MDVKGINGELNQLREKFLTGRISRREFLTKLGKIGLATPVAFYVAKMSGVFGVKEAFAGSEKEVEVQEAVTPQEVSDIIEEAVSLQMLEPIELQDNSKFKTKPPWRVGFANPGIMNAWRVCFQACIEYQASLTPEIGEFIQTDAGQKAEKQINDIEDLMGKDLDALMCNPQTSEALIPMVTKALTIAKATARRPITTYKWCRLSKDVATIFLFLISNQLEVKNAANQSTKTRGSRGDGTTLKIFPQS